MKPTEQERNDFLAGYVTAILWADTYYDTPVLHHASIDLTDPDMRALVETEEASAFLEDNLETLRAVSQAHVANMQQYGHDFALTRNGHGAGYWDRGYGDMGDVLSDAARVYGEHSVWISHEV